MSYLTGLFICNIYFIIGAHIIHITTEFNIMYSFQNIKISASNTKIPASNKVNHWLVERNAIIMCLHYYFSQKKTDLTWTSLRDWGLNKWSGTDLTVFLSSGESRRPAFVSVLQSHCQHHHCEHHQSTQSQSHGHRGNIRYQHTPIKPHRLII